MKQRKLVAQEKLIHDDAVCPLCFRPCEGTALQNHEPIDGVRHRSYFGWCLECNRGHEVIQFKPPGRLSQGRWLIYKFRNFGDSPDKPLPDSWKRVNPIPQPVAHHYAAFDDHSGGDLLEGLEEFSEQEIRVIKRMHYHLKQLARLVNHVADTFGQLHGLDTDRP